MELEINGVINDAAFAALPDLIKGATEDIDLRIDSPGGSVLTGIKIVAAIQDSAAKVTAHVSTIAASMAGYIALACDHVTISRNAVLMLHNVMVDFSGNKEDLQGVMETLKTFDQIVHNIVDAHCKDKSFSSRIDKGDVWLSGPEAAKLFDNVEVVEPAKASVLATTVDFAALVARTKAADAAAAGSDDKQDDAPADDSKPDDSQDGDGNDGQDGDKNDEPYQVSASLVALLKQADELE